MLGVACADLDQVAVVAGDVVRLQDFGKFGEGTRDAILRAGFVASNRYEGEQAQAERLRVDVCRVALENATSFELPHALEYC